MAFVITKKGNVVNDSDSLEFTCDSVADVANLPVDVPWGATAFCIEGGRLFCLNSDGIWKEV